MKLVFFVGKNLEVTLAEFPYYRFIFWYSMGAVANKNKIRIEHALFTLVCYPFKVIRL